MTTLDLAARVAVGCYLLILSVAGLSLLTIAIVVLSAYQTDRLEGWLFPAIIFLMYGVVGGLITFPLAYAAMRYLERGARPKSGDGAR